MFRQVSQLLKMSKFNLIFISFSEIMAAKTSRPCLLCEEELPTRDYREYSKHLTVQHRVVTEYDLLLKLSLLSKQNLKRILEFVGEILAECEETDDDGDFCSTVNFDSGQMLKNNIAEREEEDLKMEMDMKIKAEEEDDLEYLNHLSGTAVGDHFIEFPWVAASDIQDDSKGQGNGSKTYTVAQRNFCVLMYKEFVRDKNWYELLSKRFLEKFPNVFSAPKRKTIERYVIKLEKYKSLEDKPKPGRPNKEFSSICEECGFEVTNQKRKRNAMSHHKQRYHQAWKECPDCGKKVFDLKKHSKSHLVESERQYKCEQCGRGFAHGTHLREHYQSVHCDERPHICQYQCGYSCKSAGNLKKHERICKRNA